MRKKSFSGTACRSKLVALFLEMCNKKIKEANLDKKSKKGCEIIFWGMRQFFHHKIFFCYLGSVIFTGRQSKLAVKVLPAFLIKEDIFRIQAAALDSIVGSKPEGRPTASHNFNNIVFQLNIKPESKIRN